MTPDTFIKQYKEDAVRAQGETGVPWQITLAQAALESGWGARAPGYNFFGIKADSAWKGETTEFVTHENLHGQYVRVTARFRSYPTPEASFSDHGRFLRSNGRYRDLFNKGLTVEQFAQGLQRDGYATDPSYSAKLISIMKRFV